MQSEDRKQYTFTFPQEEESRFKKIMGRLEEDEYEIVEPISPVDKDNPRYSELQTVAIMEPEAASTFRFGMKQLKIKRLRSEEEEAELQAREDRHKVTIKVKTGGVKDE